MPCVEHFRKYNKRTVDSILDLRRQGLQKKQVAESLGISIHYVKKIFAKHKNDFIVDHEENLRAVALKDGYTYLGPYVAALKPARFVCNQGHEAFISPANFKSGHRCRKCYLANVKGSKNPAVAKYFWEDVIVACNKLNWTFLDLEKVILKNKVHDTSGNTWKFKCVCGTVISPRLADVMLGKIYSCGCLKTPTQKEVEKFINSICKYKTIFNENKALGDDLEIDIYLPDLKIGIEYNGVRYHGQSFADEKGKSYGRDFVKYKTAILKGIRLITIFESEWVFKNSQVKGYLRSIFKGKAAKTVDGCRCSLRPVSPVETKKFLDAHHIQGGPANSSLGLYYKDELVSLMSFKSCKTGYELTRFCNKTNYIVKSAFAILLDDFRSKNIGTITTFSDNRWTNGDVYKRHGFVKDSDIGLSYYYFKKNSQGPLEHKFNYRKANIKKRWPNADLSLDEWSLMKSLGYDRIWDCGKVKWLLK